jgi:phage tail-like protein
MADPYRNYKFEVEINGFTRAGFSLVSGLTETTEDITYREGGENETPHHLPGQTSYGDVTFSRGLSTDEDFPNWKKEIFDLDRSKGQQGDNESFRRDVVVKLKDKSGAAVKQWTILRAWPKELSTEDLDANANAVLVHTMILANEGIKFENL